MLCVAKMVPVRLVGCVVIGMVGSAVHQAWLVMILVVLIGVSAIRCLVVGVSVVN